MGVSVSAIPGATACSNYSRSLAFAKITSVSISQRFLSPAVAVMPSSLQPRPTRARQRWDEGIPPVLRPLVRAYVLGYASVVAPRLLTLVMQYIAKRRRRDVNIVTALSRESFVASLRRILREGLGLQRFPTFCAVVVGGTTVLEIPIQNILCRIALRLSELSRKRISRCLASFAAAWFGLQLLQSRRSKRFEETVPVKSKLPPGVEHRTIMYAGRTLDLTLFSLTRALDVIVGELWAQRRARRAGTKSWTRVDEAISGLADASVFATSCAFIMWAWFYSPSRLPRAYNKWIDSAAAVDARLVKALQRCRRGEIRYGEDTGQAPLLQGMCMDYKWPVEWGDPAKSVPYPCEIVHMGCGPSCESHAFSRFYRSFMWSMGTYLPLNLLLVARRPSFKGLKTAILAASRSSAFLGAFITLFYYGVCLTRTRLGPHIIGRDRKARNRIDSGLCVGCGCFLCGWSILLEASGRRKDMALFVAPRAMATILPRRYSINKQWRETLAFALSTAVVFTCVLENRRRVRGVLGNVLGSVLKV